MFVGFFCVVVLTTCVTTGQRTISDQNDIKEFLENFDRQAERVFNAETELAWNYYSNITDDNKKLLLDQIMVTVKFVQEAYINATGYDLTVMNPRDRRMFTEIINHVGTYAQTNETKLERFQKIQSDMETIYNTANVTMPSGKTLNLEPDLEELMATSRNYEELLAAWVGWRAATGGKIKELYPEYVELSNEAVRILGFTDTGAYWRSWFDTPTFEDDVRALFDQLRPLYEQLHAYARRKLKQIYGNDKFPSSGHIPAHLLGNMWGQKWSNLVEELTPFKDKPTINITAEMVRQNYTALRIFQTADDFLKSLGMIEMPESFWKDSVLENPQDGRKLNCYASSWDFYNGKDFRVIKCTEVTVEDLLTAHRALGSIEYYLQYKEQPIIFREEANPGFRQAVGDAIALSIQTPEHLYKIGLNPSVGNDDESDLNFLMNLAIEEIAFLPFGYLVDQWRWSVFKGDTTPDKYNDEWWSLRCKYQGLSSPVPTTSSDFDPGAKYHIPADISYVRYFVSAVIQFQFHKALCDVSGHTGPLHKCDIYNSTAAGELYSKMLQLGSSKPWPEAMYTLTGQYKMDAKPLLDYFAPLMAYLRDENGDDHGWTPNCPTA